MTIARRAPVRLRFLSLEITGRCQLTCPSLCYAASGPTRGHGTMSDDDWLRIIDEAVALGAEEVQLIGGEPTLHPGFVPIARHAVDSGLRVRVYSNLLRISEEHWRLLEHPAVRLATTYHSSVAAEHDEVTGRPGSHTATRANIGGAIRRGIPLKVAVLDAGDPGRAERARGELEALGVRDVHVGRVRSVGNAAGLALPSTAELCGRCGDQRAVVLPGGDVAVCEIGRFLTAGNVQGAGLESVLSSPRWAQASASIPQRTEATACHPDCQPSDSDSCDPGKNDPCDPMGYAPLAPGSPAAAVSALV
ncbi:radical SAM protein [Streptomyces zhihengii]|uniref:Radical SAM protein n=1 Tax=Streptomyces zhihengii TaxID=1818004 RepID=A0ABS2V5U1_9ACTN|nr:radical SAM protein [Streptomyces zhihengii]MBM9624774.1 radical SAM protein [Streptomyces zhihengii]